MPARDALYVKHILDACAQVSAYVAQGDRTRLTNDPMFRDAIIRQLQIIGEAARLLSHEFRSLAVGVQWADIIGMRHWLVHGYAAIDLDIVWDTASRDVPDLARTLPMFLPTAPQDRSPT